MDEEEEPQPSNYEISGDKNNIFVNSNVTVNNYITAVEAGHLTHASGVLESKGSQNAEAQSYSKQGTSVVAKLSDGQFAQVQAQGSSESIRSNHTFGRSRWVMQIDTLKKSTTIRCKVTCQKELYYSKECKIAPGSDGTHVFVGISDGNPVAVKKCVSESVKEKDKKVARSLLRRPLRHVLVPIDIIEDGDFIYYISSLCEWNLKEVIEEPSNPLRSILDSHKRQEVCVELLTGLKELHNLTILHRDLKPTNILFDHKGKLFVADFGVSRLLTDKTSTVTSVIGSMCWMAKEILKATGPDVQYRMSADIQVAGSLIYYILTDGHIPHESSYPYMRDRTAVIENIGKNKYSMEHLKEEQYKSLLEDMINPTPELRPKISACLNQFQSCRMQVLKNQEQAVDSGAGKLHQEDSSSLNENNQRGGGAVLGIASSGSAATQQQNQPISTMNQMTPGHNIGMVPATTQSVMTPAATVKELLKRAIETATNPRLTMPGGQSFHSQPLQLNSSLLNTHLQLQQQQLATLQQQQNTLWLQNFRHQEQTLQQMTMQQRIMNQRQQMNLQQMPMSSASNVVYQQNPQGTMTTFGNQQGVNQAANRAARPVKVLWSGMLEWRERPMQGTTLTENTWITHCINCQIFAVTDTNINGSAWPKKLTMQVIPSKLLAKIGTLLVRNSHIVNFNFPDQGTNSDSRSALVKVLHQNQFAGLILLSGEVQSNARVLLLWYVKSSNQYKGRIPKDQAGFINSFRDLIKTFQKKQEQQQRQMMEQQQMTLQQQENRVTQPQNQQEQTFMAPRTEEQMF